MKKKDHPGIILIRNYTEDDINKAITMNDGRVLYGGTSMSVKPSQTHSQMQVVVDVDVDDNCSLIEFGINDAIDSSDVVIRCTSKTGAIGNSTHEGVFSRPP